MKDLPESKAINAQPVAEVGGGHKKLVVAAAALGFAALAAFPDQAQDVFWGVASFFDPGY
jgi:hypothetical protein